MSKTASLLIHGIRCNFSLRKLAPEREAVLTPVETRPA